ncbi:damage-inducible type I toxin DinQ [Buttiauxella sp. B2]
MGAYFDKAIMVLEAVVTLLKLIRSFL